MKSDKQDTYQDLIQSMPEMAKAVNAFDGDATRKEALRALLGTKLGIEPVTGGGPSGSGTTTTKSKVPTTKKTNKASTRKKKSSKNGPSHATDLDLRTAGIQSLEDFVAEKQPKNQRQKSTVVVYYLQRTMGLSGITVDEVYTAYQAMSWPKPTNFANHLQQVKSAEGWIDTANMADIKVTIPGENFVEYKLPAGSPST